MFKIQYLAENWKPDGTNILHILFKRRKTQKEMCDLFEMQSIQNNVQTAV